MMFKTSLFLIITTVATAVRAFPQNIALPAPSFDISKDLLLVQYDCKTDVDDLHSVAALTTLLTDTALSTLNYHAVAGTYGMQEGLYVPPNDLFQLAFGNNWTDAHANISKAVEKVSRICINTLLNSGDIWIAEAGQSDFTALLIKAVQQELASNNYSQRIHVVQHSDWNESVTTSEYLQYVKANSDYHKIPDGNVVGNGTPGFQSPQPINLKNKFRDPKQLEIWRLAIELSNTYNGKEGRYTNKSISDGGFDFSDLVEVCWILGTQQFKDVEQFFDYHSTR